MGRVRVRVPATTANLGPGFDALGMALNLHNLVEMEEIDEGLQITVSGEGAEMISRHHDNIVYQAAMDVFQKVGYQPKGLAIHLNNVIPVARGLGSSAAALVGGVVAANEISGNKLTDEELLQIANDHEGHPDNVAPALLGGVVVSTQVDGEVFSRKIPPPYGLRAVVAVPDFPLSTKVARSVLPEEIPFQDAVFNVSRVSLVLVAIIHNDWELLSKVMDDRLHQPYRTALVPGMDEVFAAAKKAGALASTLSGAGPTLIAFCREHEEAIAQAMKDTFKRHGVNCATMELKPSPKGAEVF